MRTQTKAVDTFRGYNHSVKNSAKWITTRTFWFGGQRIPAGSEVRQFETRNHAWTVWNAGDGWNIARE